MAEGTDQIRGGVQHHAAMLDYAKKDLPKPLPVRPDQNRFLLTLAGIFCVLWLLTAILPALVGSQRMWRYYWQIPALAGVTCAIVVLSLASTVRSRALRHGHRGSEMAMALTIASIAALLLSCLTPIAGKMGAARPRANQIKCASNLRQIGQGIMLYASDYGQYPDTLERLLENDLDAAVMICPSSEHTRAQGDDLPSLLADFRKPGRCSYVYVAGLSSNSPASAILAYELSDNHKWERAGMNVLFNDGHVEWVDGQTAAWFLSELTAGHNPPRDPAWPALQP
jgi:prepilin-type processing-associated H-X9-DG protein